MPVFEWEGRSLNGELKRGVLTADSDILVRATLRKDGIILLKATEKKRKKGRATRGI